MDDGDQRHGKEPVAAAAEAEAEENEFPVGMRVLAVDDDPVCRRVLEVSLRYCKYSVTMVANGETALEMLRAAEGGEEQFDLVITDVHMPGMDGFKLLEIIGLEMDLPVIMLSANGEKATVLKGIKHGACDYLVKPVHLKELKHIWQHVIRKNPGLVNLNNSDSDDVDQMVVQPPVTAEGEQGGAKSKKCSKKKKHDRDHSDENKERASVPTTRKKPRVSWTGELHGRFLEVVNQLGVDKAVPKSILQMMNVDYLTRESVASHLQKYRIYLKRVADYPIKSTPLGVSSTYLNMRHRGSLCNNREHQRGRPSSTACFPCTDSLYLGPHGLSIQPRSWSMGAGGGNGGSTLTWLPDDARWGRASGLPVNSFTDTSSDHARCVLRGKMLEASNVAPSSHPGNSSLAEMPNGGLFQPANQQLQVQPPELNSQFSGLMNAAPSAVVGERRDAQSAYLVGSSGYPWQNMAPSGFPGHMDGAPLAQSQVNFPQFNQQPSFGTSPGQMPMFQNEQQNQMAGININSEDVYSMTPLFNMASNMAPEEMSSDNFSPMTQMVINDNDGSTSPALPDLQADSSVAPPTQIVNPGDASGILPVQEDPADQQAPDDQPTYSDPYFLEDIFNGMLNQDFNDDVIFRGEY